MSIHGLQAGPSTKGSKSNSISQKSEAVKRRNHLKAEALKWKAIETSGAMLDEGGGMMMLEEVDGVDVEWEEDDEGGKRAVLVEAEDLHNRKRKRSSSPQTPVEAGSNAEVTADDIPAPLSKKQKQQLKQKEHKKAKKEAAKAAAVSDVATPAAVVDIVDTLSFDEDLLPGWSQLPLCPALKRGLFISKFSSPTDIQSRAIPLGLSGRDVVGVAETGSGKTMAYGLPILNHILTHPPADPATRRPLISLILCPTRELALQVAKHLSRLVEEALFGEMVDENVKIEAEELSDQPEGEEQGEGEEVESKSEEGAKVKSVPAKPRPTQKGPPRISIISVVGGLSVLKQRRLVQRGCDILIATPGRLWDLIQEDEGLAVMIKGIRYLVVDEADRMIEGGHFEELESIVALTARGEGDRTVNMNAEEDDPTFARAARTVDQVYAREDIQTFVFSATLSKDLQANLKRGGWKGARKGKKAKGSTLDDLVERLDFRDENPEVIDLSPEGGLVASLRESIVECLTSEKDLYLYYFLLRYPGRSLVFMGSIDGIRRLIPLFEILKIPVFPLHSQLQQKQRLKNLDRFTSSKTGILISTDVASRGLDIPSVDHVIHFQLPRTADAYIHRSGRTARAKRAGFSLQMCSPEERGMQKALMKSLGRSPDLPELQIEPGFLPKLKERLQLAKQIEKAQHHQKKDSHERNWIKETAEAMDIDIDPDMMSDSESDVDAPRFHKKNKPSATKLLNLQAELNNMLGQQLMARGVSAKYPTSGSKVVVDDLLTSSNHSAMLGSSTKKAHEDVDSRPTVKKDRKFLKKKAPGSRR